MPEGLKYRFIQTILAGMFFLAAVACYGQTTIRGAVTDANTGEPLPFVSVFAEGTQAGRNTDFNGQYILETTEQVTTLRFSLLGYKTETVNVTSSSSIVNVKLKPEVRELKEITVESRKQRYRNKDNPAVELIRRVIDRKKENRKDQLASFEYEKYEKVQFALSNISEKFMKKKYLKNFQFIFENLDSNQIPGKVILPMYLQETLSDVYYRKSPKDLKEIIKGTRKVDFDDFVNNDGISTFVGYLYQDVNIYDNTVPILTNPFVSPIADNGPLFYRYYIKDTVDVDGTRCYHMVFYPRNKSDFLFQGELYITFDDKLAIRKTQLTVSPDINLNFVKELRLNQEFTEAAEGEWLLSRDEIAIDFGIGKGGLGLFGQRAVSFKDFRLNEPKPDDFYKGLTEVVVDTNRSEEFWDQHRHAELTRSEKGVSLMIDSIQKVPAFRRTMNLFILIFAGYKDFGLFEIGPINTFYSYNPIEGVRARFGGRTTKEFSEKLHIETYVAYGFKDERWKYFIGGTYAFGKKSYLDFPLRNLSVSYQDETKIPGQELQFVQEDNVLLSIKRGENNMLLYNKILTTEYKHEFPSHFSFALGYQHLTQSPAGALYFNRLSYNDFPQARIPDITTAEMSLSLRYAPKEQFYQGKTYRIPMYNSYPIFFLRVAGSWKDFMASDYTYQDISASIFKRFTVSPLGYSNVVLEGGTVLGRVPYPLLDIHRANQTYSYQLQSYNLMNFLEFVSDRYFSLNIDHYFNGFFFNKIPLFKRLKWREVASFKLLYGTITSENDPSQHSDLFKFPVRPDGTLLTHSLEEKPYMEASVGIANIFKLFRVDLIKRLSYLEHPNVSEYGVRARFKLDF